MISIRLPVERTPAKVSVSALTSFTPIVAKGNSKGILVIDVFGWSKTIPALTKSVANTFFQ